MNPTTKARLLRSELEKEGWLFGLVWNTRLHCYEVHFGQRPGSNSTVYTDFVYVYTHGNGKVSKSINVSEVRARNWEYEWPRSGYDAINVDGYIRHIIETYASACIGSPASDFIPEYRLSRH